MKLPTNPGAVIRWKYRYDGIYQYQAYVLTENQDYEKEELVWYRSVGGKPWSQVRMQMTVDSGGGTWEILHEGEQE